MDENSKKYKKNSYISSIILLITSIIYHIILYKKNLFSISLIFLGFTSCKHHSRFEKWIINDIYKGKIKKEDCFIRELATPKLSCYEKHVKNFIKDSSSSD